MKFKYIILSLFASATLFPACVQVDDLAAPDSVGTTKLTITGYLVKDYSEEIPSVIDHEAGTITVQVPYYVSDVEPIMGDLTQMKLVATMPTGYTFSPSLSGIHDLSEGYRTTLFDYSGNPHSYTIKAEYVKSSACAITSAVLVNMPRATVVLTAPEAGKNGKISIYKTSSALDAALRAVEIKASPWATIECSAIDPQTGYIDFSELPQITVTAQDGTKCVYDVIVDYPTIKDQGVGYCAALFGFQTKDNDPHGCTAGANYTMAVVDDYLIVSNSLDVTAMPVYDRFSGELLENVHVNTTGMPTDRQFKAICNDDAGHLIAAAYCNNNTAYNGGKIEEDVRIYAWVNGIENAPKSIVWANMAGSIFGNLATKHDMYWNVTCKGDITSGNAAIATSSKAALRFFIIPFVDGVAGTGVVDWGGNGSGYGSLWSASKCSLLNTEAPFGYIWDQGMARMGIYYVTPGTGWNPNRALYMTQPTSHWWVSPNPGGPNWAYCVRSNAVIDFNGTRLLATTNGLNGGSERWTWRLYVADIGFIPSETSLNNLVFDSREGNMQGTAAVPGSGPVVTGMTSTYAFENGGSVFSLNSDQMNDVIFARSDDGNAIQVYMLVHDQGLIAYEMTRFDI